MSELFDKVREEIILTLLDARKYDPWSRERIALKFDIPHNTQEEKNSFKRFIQNLIRHAEPGTSLTLIGNDGKGYYFPEYEDEAEQLRIKREKIGKGFFKSAKKFERYRQIAKKRPEQLTLEDVGVDIVEGS